MRGILFALLHSGVTRKRKPGAFIVAGLGIALAVVLTLVFSGPAERRAAPLPLKRMPAVEAGQWMDLHLDRVWSDLGLTMEDFDRISAEPRSGHGDRWYLRIFQLQPTDRKQFNALVRELNHLPHTAGGHSFEASWTEQENKGKRLDLSVNGYPTHRILIAPVAVPPPTVAIPPPLLPPSLRPAPPAPRIALVMDDLGNRLEPAHHLLDMDVSLTLAVFPGRPFSRIIAEKAHSRGLEVILHLPMEPWDYPEKDPGAGALLVSMDEADLKRTVLEDLQDIPQARGVNNHMGSRFTEQSSKMAKVMDILSQKGLYFMDSLTTSRSTGYQAAKDRGIPAYRRDVFLDVVQEKDAIRRQFRELMRVAQKRGYAVGICHPYPETLSLLAELYRESGRAGIRWVTLSRLHRTSPVDPFAPPSFMTAGPH